MKKKKNSQIDFKTLESDRSQSGKTVVEFCEDRGIKPSVYYYWRKKSRKQDTQKFIPVKATQRIPGSGIRILYPNGVQLELYGTMDADQIKTLVDVRL